MTLYEYVIIHHPKPVPGIKGKMVQALDVLLQAPTCVLANNRMEVMMYVARALPTQYFADLDEIEVCIRRFCSSWR